MNNSIKSRSGKTLILNTPEEEAAIQKGIAADSDTYELTDDEFKKLRPWPEVKAELDAKRKKSGH